MNYFTALSLSFLFCLAAKAEPLLLKVPKTHFEFWNYSFIQYQNNCYNYATNRVTNSFAQPGEAAGEMYTDLNCKNVYAAAKKDLGLTPVEFFGYKDKDDETLIALVVAPDYDFHWYRRDDNNMWTHKNGSYSAKDYDESGEKISDPETADRGRYTDFCGYFKVKNFPAEKHEQDAGYVRIGDMEELPKNQSELVISMYSGRKNPSFRLSDLLKDSELSKDLRALAGKLKDRMKSGQRKNFTPPLGHVALQIIDHEGLIFPKSTTVIVDEWLDNAEQPLHRDLIQKLRTRK